MVLPHLHLHPVTSSAALAHVILRSAKIRLPANELYCTYIYCDRLKRHRLFSYFNMKF